ncbi:MAG: PIN domain-containing protein [Candidatus Sulfotelmatobacter sp.]
MHSPAAAPVGLIDTGAILALLDRDDEQHKACVAAYNHHRLPWLTTEAVLTEVLHLVRRNVRDDRGVWQLLQSGAIQTSTIANEELPHIQILMDDYADRPMDFADATLVHVAARERLSLILTIDHDDFETYRLPGRKKFTILPRP